MKRRCGCGGRARGWRGRVGIRAVVTRRRVFVALRAIPIGWACLALLVFLVEHPVLRWTGPLLGAQWLATGQLGLDCGVLVATGWVVGRLSRPYSMFGVLVFAATLSFWDVSFLVAINVPWLVRLAVHTVSGDGNYLSSLVSTAGSQVLLFACLVGGGLLSRARETPVSIVGDR
jgi:hypothetical protein